MPAVVDDLGNSFLPPSPVEPSVTGSSPQQPEAGGIALSRKKRKSQYAMEWAKRNPDKVKANQLRSASRSREYKRQWRIRNRERLMAKDRLRYNRSEKVREQKRLWKEKNREKCRESDRAWNKRNPHAKYNQKARKRAGLTDNAGIAEFIKCVRRKKFIECFHCGKRISGKKCHIDHIIALAIGGKHEVGNLGASCSKCNFFKGARTLNEWNQVKEGQLVLL